MESPTDPKNLVHLFNECINRKDVAGLERLMSDDHRFIDAEEGVDEGKRDSLSSWLGFFTIYPDFRHKIKKVTIDGDLIKIEGKASCSDNRLAGSAILTARVDGDKISE